MSDVSDDASSDESDDDAAQIAGKSSADSKSERLNATCKLEAFAWKEGIKQVANENEGMR